MTQQDVCEQLLPTVEYDSKDSVGLFENRIPPIHQEWLSTEEAAAYLRLSIGSLRNLTSNGVIPRYKLGSRNRYRQEELRHLLLQNKGDCDGI